MQAAIRRLPDKGVEVMLINPHPATLRGHSAKASYVYLLPLKMKSIIQGLEDHPRTEALLSAVGEAIALDLVISCETVSIWKVLVMRSMRVNVHTIESTKAHVKSLNQSIKKGVGVSWHDAFSSFLPGKKIAREINFSLMPLSFNGRTFKKLHVHRQSDPQMNVNDQGICFPDDQIDLNFTQIYFKRNLYLSN